jgi:hypothetical protein
MQRAVGHRRDVVRRLAVPLLHPAVGAVVSPVSGGLD